jgi:hypothetical protein
VDHIDCVQAMLPNFVGVPALFFISVLCELFNLTHAEAQESPALRGAAASQVLVFDAGSSGTRVHVFNLLPANGGEVPQIELAVRDAQTKKIKPGLSSFAEKDDLVGAEKNIDGLLEFANQYVPVDRRASTPALLKATAGLRAVKPAAKADAVLAKVRAVLAKSGYLFKPEWADIIQGKEEAGLAWVAANYLQGTFSQKYSAAKSLGVIEMGGGSTQVSFEVGSIEEVSKLEELDSFTFTTLSGAPHQLYAHSYLGYGLDHAQAKLRSMMATESEDPCYPVGYNRPGQKKDDEATLVTGTGDATACQTKIKEHLFDASQKGAPGQYFGELALRGAMAATENFFYVRSDLKLPLDGNIKEMRKAAVSGCSTAMQPTDADKADMEAGKANPSQPNACFGLSFQAALMDVFKADTIAGLQVQIARKINGGDIDWAMGAALKHFIDSGLAAGAQPDQLPLAVRGVLVLIFAIAAIGVLRFFLGPKFCQLLQLQSTHVVKATTGVTIGSKGRGDEYLE